MSCGSSAQLMISTANLKCPNGNKFTLIHWQYGKIYTILILRTQTIIPDVCLPATPSSKLLSVTSQQPTTAKSKSNSSLSSESVFVENTVNTAELGENSNNYVPIFLDSTQVYTGVHKTQSSKNYKDGQFPCEICKTCVFRSRHDLKMHMRQHKDEKPYKCSHCSYRSKHNANLKLHIAHRHSNARPFHCPVCSHTSKSSSDLRKHMIVHSGKKRTRKKWSERMGCVEVKLESRFWTHTLKRTKESLNVLRSSIHVIQRLDKR